MSFNNKTTIFLRYFDSILKLLPNQNDLQDFEMESKYQRKIVVLLLYPNLEFTRCHFSEYVFSYILLDYLLVMVFGQYIVESK